MGQCAEACDIVAPSQRPEQAKQSYVAMLRSVLAAYLGLFPIRTMIHQKLFF